ncbi:hypothetical protein BGZ94_002576 [Podila epigama]|nr:hypothetical protein BGZ94_002576 [Podila epigama]
MDPNAGISHRFKCTLLKERALKEEQGQKQFHASTNLAAATAVESKDTGTATDGGADVKGNAATTTRASTATAATSESPAVVTLSTAPTTIAATVAATAMVTVAASAVPSEDLPNASSLNDLHQAYGTADMMVENKQTSGDQPPSSLLVTGSCSGSEDALSDVNMGDFGHFEVNDADGLEGEHRIVLAPLPAANLFSSSSRRGSVSLHPFDIPASTDNSTSDITTTAESRRESLSGRDTPEQISDRGGWTGCISAPLPPVDLPQHSPGSESQGASEMGKEDIPLSDERVIVNPRSHRQAISLSNHRLQHQHSQSSMDQSHYQTSPSFTHGDYNDDMNSGLSHGFKGSEGGHQHSRSQTVDAIMTNPMSTGRSMASGHGTSFAASAASASLSTLTLAESGHESSSSGRPYSQIRSLQPMYRHISTHSTSFTSLNDSSSSSSATCVGASGTTGATSSTSVSLLNVHPGSSTGSVRQQHDSTSAKRKNSLGVNLGNASHCSSFSSNGNSSSSSTVHSNTGVTLGSSSSIFPGPRRTSTSASTTNEDLKRVRCSRPQSNTSGL